jgi:hypothetical protein
MTQEVTSARQAASGIVPFQAWLDELTKTRATGHRWRKEYPWLNEGIVNVFGKLYIRRETIAEFERRALAGELAKEIKPEVEVKVVA